MFRYSCQGTGTVIWSQSDFEENKFRFDDLSVTTCHDFIDYWNQNILVSPAEFVAHLGYGQTLELDLFPGVNVPDETRGPEKTGLKIGILASPEGSSENYSDRYFYLNTGLVTCENVINHAHNGPRFDMPKHETGTILAAADVGANKLSLFAWGALGSVVWPRSYGYIPTDTAWQDTSPKSMRSTILERVNQLADIFPGDQYVNNDYQFARNVLTSSSATPHDFVLLMQRSTPVPLEVVHDVGCSHKVLALRADENGNVPFGFAIGADLPAGFDVELDMGNLAQIAHVVGKAGIDIRSARDIMMRCDRSRAHRQNYRPGSDNISISPPAPRP